MKLPLQPNFSRVPTGNALGPVAGTVRTAVAEEAVSKAFDVAFLAGMGRLNFPAARGLGASNLESRPDLVAAAQSNAAAQGITLNCREEFIWHPGGGYYNRCCAAPGGFCAFSADIIAGFTAPDQWERLKGEIGMVAADVELNQIMAQPWYQGGSPAPDPQAESVQPSNWPVLTPVSAPAPQPVSAPQPGQVQATPIATTGQAIANGLAEQARSETEGLASMFGGNNMALVAVAAVAVLLLMGGKNN